MKFLKQYSQLLSTIVFAGIAGFAAFGSMIAYCMIALWTLIAFCFGCYFMDQQSWKSLFYDFPKTKRSGQQIAASFISWLAALPILFFSGMPGAILVAIFIIVNNVMHESYQHYMRINECQKN